MKMSKIHQNVSCSLAFLLLFSGCLCRRQLTIKESLEYSTKVDDIEKWREKSFRELTSATDLSLAIADDPANATWKPLFSFIHVSDVQIRDYAIHYWDLKSTERIVDGFAQSTVRNKEQDTHDEYPWLALAGGLRNWLQQNNCHPDLRRTYFRKESREEDDKDLICVKDKPLCPRFLIHTGDSIDVGSEGELHRFLSIANQFTIPWYNVIGNHDIFLMGNFTENDIDIKNAPAQGLPLVLNRGKFMRLHGISALGPTALHKPTAFGCNGMPPSKYHGFDLISAERDASQIRKNLGTMKEHVPLRSYYSMRFEIKNEIDQDNSKRRPMIRMIVLDTTAQHSMVPHLGPVEKAKHGSWGFVEPEQYSWLKDELAEAEQSGDLVLLFGHHPLLAPDDKGSKSEGLGELQGQDPDGNGGEERYTPIRKLVVKYKNILAYFTGHTHIRRDVRIPGSNAIEITAPSLHEIPQYGFLVTVLEDDIKKSRAISIRSIQGTTPNMDMNPKGATAPHSPIASGLIANCQGAALDKSISPSECKSRPYSNIFEVGSMQDTKPANYDCLPIYDPAPGRKRLMSINFNINLFEWSEPELMSEHPRCERQSDGKCHLFRLRGLLPFLEKVGACFHFSFAPEVGELATEALYLNKYDNKDAPIVETLDELIGRLPEVKNGCGDRFKAVLERNSITGEFIIAARRTHQGCEINPPLNEQTPVTQRH